MDSNYLPMSFFQMINPDNTMSCNRFIAHAIGATETIIYFSLISKMTYYYKNGMLDDEGFFYATAIDIQESTTFTKRQQMPAINRLVEIGLIETKSAGLPKKKYYKVLNKQELLISLIEQGEEIAAGLHNKVRKPHDNQMLQNVTSSSAVEKNSENADKPHEIQKLQNVTSCGDKMSPQQVTKSHHSELQNVTSCGDKMSPLYKTKDNKLKISNPKSINQSAEQITVEEITSVDSIDVIDFSQQRKYYEKLIAQRIGYADYQSEGGYRADLVKAMYSVIVDSICSSNPTLRINSSNVPQETVKDTFLKLDSSHIEYILDMLEEHKPDMTNIQSYLRTALYNAVGTKDMYYSSKLKAAGIIK